MSEVFDENSQTSDDGSPIRKKKKDFFKSLLPNKVSNENNEVDFFLKEEISEAKSVLKYPTLTKIFLKYNIGLPSSASVERLFSCGGLIFRPTRCNLSDTFFESLLFLKVNSNTQKDW